MSIFSDTNKVQANWAKFVKVGDKIEGTFISKRQVMNSLRNEMQIIYELMTEDGEIWNVGGKKGIDMQMRHVREGQIIGFEFIEERKPSKPGLNPIKIIQVYANSAIVNEKWLKDQDEINKLYPVSAGNSVEFGGITNEQEKLIYATATDKLPEVNLENYKRLIMEKTGLAFIEANYSEILEKLTNL